MASSGSADEDFKSRVDRIFGSLAFSRSSSSNLSTSSAPPSRPKSSSVWSLSDKDVEKREWKREQLTSYDRDEIPCAATFNELLRQQRISSTEGEDILEKGGDDELSIRASMGLDRTLDDEEEEDEYDKVALGKENDREDARSKLSIGRTRDPRANHVAAKIRLKEDEVEANSKVSSTLPSKRKEPPHSEESSKAVPPKPILKRKENSSDPETRTSKRVRFAFVSEETLNKPEDTCSASSSLKSVPHQGKTDTRVPDYLQNPSKYTCYSFDESNDNTPAQDYIDIPKTVEELETSESESFKKVSFIPQKKTKDVKVDDSNGSETKPIVAGQVAEDERPGETEDGETEIEESEKCTSFQSKGRQYRAKQSLDETDV